MLYPDPDSVNPDPKHWYKYLSSLIFNRSINHNYQQFGSIFSVNNFVIIYFKFVIFLGGGYKFWGDGRRLQVQPCENDKVGKSPWKLETMFPSSFRSVFFLTFRFEFSIFVIDPYLDPNPTFHSFHYLTVSICVKYVFKKYTGNAHNALKLDYIYVLKLFETTV